MKDKKEIKKITVGLIFSWIFGIMFLVLGLGILFKSVLSGLIIVLCSVLIIPYSNQLISEKFHFSISGGVKILLMVIIVIAMISGSKNDVITKTSGYSILDCNNQCDKTYTDSTEQSVCKSTCNAFKNTGKELDEYVNDLKNMKNLNRTN